LAQDGYKSQIYEYGKKLWENLGHLQEYRI
jgi:hypothetical protein